MKIHPTCTLLVVCTASEFRSPVAAALIEKQMVSRGIWHLVTIATAGTRAQEGSAPNPFAVRILRDRYGIDISGHRSRPLTDEMIATTQMIVVMSEDQRRHIFYRSPRALNHVYLLNELAADPTPVRDPHASGSEEYEVVIRVIGSQVEKAMPSLLQKLGLDDECAAAVLTELQSPTDVARPSLQ